MPVSPALAENLARSLADRYARAERLLLARVARNLSRGIDAPFWVERKLAQMQAYRVQAERMVAALERAAPREVRAAIAAAYERGGLAAVADLNKLGATTVESLAGQRAIEALTQETLGYVTATHPRILRSTMDLYRSVIAQASSGILTGAQTRREAAQAALDAFAKKGITGFVDAAGRGWNLESYTEMAMRTGAGKAAVQGHVDRLAANGVDLVIVSDAPKECPLCRKFEGKVFSISGSSKRYRPLQEARDGGLFHCNCRHSLSAYQEGITPPMHGTADPKGYEATTKLRYYERQIRSWKRRQAVAMDDFARAKAGAHIRAYQAKIRELVATTSAKRLPYRERLGVI